MAHDHETVEQMMERLGCKANYISQLHITKRIVQVSYEKIRSCGQLFIYCFIKMDNGFVVNGQPATCMNEDNWRDEIGQKVSFDNTFSEIFKLEAYRTMSANTLDIENIAKRCHEVNRAYCESIGDTSQVPWSEAPDWQKQSAINGVKFRLDNPNVTSAQMHENWMKDKEADGWVYGEVKDIAAKTHPCMLPYDQLPKEQQIKDRLFAVTVDTEKELYAK
ncbi:hypothetical protein KW516_19210 [Vibrio fluvialis]|nr:hypothetical protein [Vibrio fluvialis]